MATHPAKKVHFPHVLSKHYIRHTHLILA